MDQEMLPVFKKVSISTRSILDYMVSGTIRNYSDDPNKRNALRQTAEHFKVVNDELYRHGSDREYAKYGLRVVIHDDEPQKKMDIIHRGHVDEQGNHYGMNNTIKNVNKLHYWQGVSAHVKVYLKKCSQCKERSRFSVEEWIEEEKRQLTKKKKKVISAEARNELRNLGKIKKPTPPETFFIVNAERKVDLGTLKEDAEMLIDSNNIEYVVETLGYTDEFHDLKEVCHVLNVPDIIPIPERFRSREIETFLKYGTYPEDFTSNQKSGLRGPAAQYCIIKDELYHEGNKNGSKSMRQVIHDDLPALKVKIMVECHLDDDGVHLGLNRTLNRIGVKYFWVGLSVDVRKFMLKCKLCAASKGRKQDADTAKFLQEVEELKKRQREMKRIEAEAADEAEPMEPYSQEIVEQAQAANMEAETYSQVIRLLGQNQENITEITVEVVNGEQYTAQQVVGLQSQAEAHIETEMAVDQNETDANTEAESLAAAALIEAGDIVNVKSEPGSVGIAENNYVEEDNLVQEGMYQADEEENSVGTGIDDNTEIMVKREAVNTIEIHPLKDNDGTTEPGNFEGESENMDSTNNQDLDTVCVGGDSVVIENVGDTGEKIITTNSDGLENKDPYQSDEAVDNGNSVTTVNDICAEVNEKTAITGQIVSEPSSTKSSPLISFYQDIIYVPKNKKTRAIELFMLTGNLTTGYTSTKMVELSQNLEIKDDVLFRRPSRYKGRQIVIHDDCPELKLKIIEEFHCKPSGDHFSELITIQNINYRYYWEEMKWDVKRFYLKCSTCVKNGEDLRTKKKVLSVEEKKKKKEEDRRKSAEQGISAKRNKDFRNRMKDKFDTFKKWKKFGKGNPNAVMYEENEINDDYGTMALELIEGELQLDGTRSIKPEYDDTQDESDIEINMPESDEEEGVISVITSKPSFQIKLYATLDQEQCVRELFQDNGWSYKLENLHRSTDEKEKKKQSLGGDKDVYLLIMDVLLEQEQAIRKLFNNKNWEYSLEALQLQETPSSSIERQPRHASPRKTVKPKQAKSQVCVVDDKKSSDKNNEVETRAGRSREAMKEQLEKTSKQVAAEMAVDYTDAEVESLVMECETKQTPSRSKGTKRDASELYTPVTGERRSRREVKKPRRFSPDDLDVKPIIKIEKDVVTVEPAKETPGRAKRLTKAIATPNVPKSNKKGSDSRDKTKLLSSLSLSSVDSETTSTPVANKKKTGEADTGSSDHKITKNVAKSSTGPSDEQVQQKSAEKINVGKSPAKNDKINSDAKDFSVEDFFALETKDETKMAEGGKDLEVDNDNVDDDYEDDDEFMDDDLIDDEDDDEMHDEYEEGGGNEMSSALKILLNDVARETMEVVNLGDVYMCPLCDAQFLTEKQCVQHGFENECFEECQLCGKVYKKNQQDLYMDHVMLHENGDKFPCESCDKVFFSPQHLQVHGRIHEDERLEQCAICSEEFYTSFQLASHMLRKHQESNMFSCDICKAKFVNISFMKSEVFFDGELSYFKCVMCNNK